MKKMTRMLCLLLSVLMLLSLVACGNDPTIQNSSKQQGNTDPASSNPNGIDFGGKTIKIAVWYEPEIPSLGDSDSEDAWYYSLKNACEAFNCEVEWIVETQDAHFTNFIQKSLAGEVYADILLCHSWNYVSLISQGLLHPTTEYVANAEDAERWNQNSFVLNGENWGIMPKVEHYVPTYSYLINTKLLSSLGLEHPQELARRGEWTWEKFRQYCAAATDPSKEQYGVGSFMIAHMLKTSNNFDYAVKGEDGKYYNAFTYPETKDRAMEVLEMVQTMALEDKSILGDWTDGVEPMNESLNAFKDGKLLFAYVPMPSSLKNSGFEDYSVVTLPQGPSSTGLCDTIEAFSFYALPTYSNFDHADLAAFWMEAKRTWDPSDEEGYYEQTLESRIEEILDESYINRADVEFLLEMGATMTYGPAVNVRWGSLIADNIFGEVIRGNSTPAAVIESTAGEVQALIDATYNTE